MLFKRNTFVRYLLVFPGLLLTPGLLAQIADPTLPEIQVIPPTPEAASLGKYGEIPVSNFTGIPSISIPLHTVQGRKMSVPISINYHAGGIKVEENASRIGLGWSLSAGGIISRNMRGYRDEANNGYLNAAYKPSDYQQIFSQNAFPYDDDRGPYLDSILQLQNQIIGLLSRGEIEFEPDYYSFSTVGNSGSFFLHEDDRPVPVPMQDVKIELSEIEAQHITKWTLTHADGSQFHFGRNKQNTYASYDKTLSILGGENFVNPDEYITSWYLMDMYSADGRDSILFSYEPITLKYHNSTTEERSWVTQQNLREVCVDKGHKPMEYSTHEASSMRIKRIVSIHDSVVFNYGEERLDLPADHRLASVDIYQRGGQLIKSYVFYHGYFDGNCSLPTDTMSFRGGVLIESTYDELCKRLRLDSIQEVGSNGTLKPSHIFEYNTQVKLPQRFSNSIDYWGYYNGKLNVDSTGTSLGFIPTTYFQTHGFKLKYEGADRRADPSYARANILEKITYPAGGTTTFSYEGNEIELDGSSQLIPSSLATHEHLIDHNSIIDDPQSDIYRDTICISNLFGVLEYTLSLASGCNNFNGLNNEIGCTGATFQASLKDMEGDVVYVLNGPSQGSSNIYHGKLSFLLPDGQYVLEVHVTDGNTLDSNTSVKVFWDELVLDLDADRDQDGLVEMPAGGLRVKKITHEDLYNPAAKQVINYKYNFNDGQVISWMPSPPIFVFYPTDSKNPCKCASLKWVSKSAYPGATAQGSYVCYPQVEIQYGEQGSNGKSQFKYAYHQNYDALNPFLPYIFGSEAKRFVGPYTPPTDVDWRRGNLLFQKDYSREGKLLKSTENTYKWIFSTEDSSRWVTAFHFVLYPEGGCGGQYYNMTESHYLSQSVEKIYSPDNSAPPLVTTTNYTYGHLDKHQFPTQISTSESDGDTLILEQKYAPELWRERWPGLAISDLTLENQINNESLSEEERSWGYMLKEHIIQMPLEQKSWYIPKDSSRRQLKSSQRTECGIFYRDINQGQKGFLAPKRVDVAELSVPIAEPDLSNLSALYVPKLQYLGYDHLANLVSFSKDQDVPSSFIWGYEGRFPIAKVVQADASEIAYTGFESSSTGNWQFDYTGSIPGQDCTEEFNTCVANAGNDFEKYMICDDAQQLCWRENSQPGLPALQYDSTDTHTGGRSWISDTSYELSHQVINIGTYYVSLWAKGSGGSITVNGISQSTSEAWQLYEWEIPIATAPQALKIVLSAGLRVDDVRLHPQKAQMSTYNYIPLRGIASMTDPNHISSFYEYDDLGRLKLIRDSDGNILQQYDYQYKSRGGN